jgi:uncharacterized membrane protein
VRTPIGTRTEDGHDFYLKRNCSISPKSLALIFMVLGLFSVLIGIIFYTLGANLILPFSFVEVFALATAYFFNALHANDFEHLKIDKEHIYFESKYGRKFRKEKFIKSMTRVFPSTHKNLVNLSQGKKNIILGYNVHINCRPILESEIRRLI